ncbi:hypothetical protein ACLB6G_18770 [Zhengella sp. ZM62]|uniref:hypothetical protein n=1 Tax=Zhengella sedimenti TaxID=3390035 RepID=UPI0039761061
MTDMKIRQPDPRRSRHETPTHFFSVGQAVQMKGRFTGSRSPAGVFQITATLPPKGNSPQYRIRNEAELHERVATQDDIEAVTVPRSNTALLERTFGHG